MTAANGGSVASDTAGAGRNVLVVSTVAEPAAALGAELQEDDIVKVVVPVVGQGLLDWLANDERAFSRASETAETTAKELPGMTVDAAPGEADVALAIRDALATFPADEIVVAVEPDSYDIVDEALAADDSAAGARTIQGVPVRVVTLVGRTAP